MKLLFVVGSLLFVSLTNNKGQSTWAADGMTLPSPLIKPHLKIGKNTIRDSLY
jgi:hypothetical protein